MNDTERKIWIRNARRRIHQLESQVATLTIELNKYKTMCKKFTDCIIDMNADYREQINPRFTIADNGDLTIHVREGYDYEITHDRLKESDWIGHISRKGWPDFNFGDFVIAYLYACHKVGIKQVLVDTRDFTDKKYKQ